MIGSLMAGIAFSHADVAAVPSMVQPRLIAARSVKVTILPFSKQHLRLNLMRRFYDPLFSFFYSPCPENKRGCCSFKKN